MKETRFDIVFVVSTVSQFRNNPGLQYIARVKRIFQYISKYPNLGITYKKGGEFLLLYSYVDPNWAIHSA